VLNRTFSYEKNESGRDAADIDYTLLDCGAIRLRRLVVERALWFAQGDASSVVADFRQAFEQRKKSTAHRFEALKGDGAARGHREAVRTPSTRALSIPAPTDGRKCTVIARDNLIDDGKMRWAKILIKLTSKGRDRSERVASGC